MLIKRSLLNQARLLGCTLDRAFTEKHIIEIPSNSTKLLLQEQKFNSWLLIRDGNPQVLLKTKEALKFIKKLKGKHNSGSIVNSH